MPSWAKVSENSNKIYLINQSKISDLSSGSSSIEINKITNIRLIKETTNKYKSSSQTPSDIEI